MGVLSKRAPDVDPDHPIGRIRPRPVYSIPYFLPHCNLCARRASLNSDVDPKSEQAGVDSRRYLNRLSDLLFVLARYLNVWAGTTDVIWNHERKSKDAS